MALDLPRGVCDSWPPWWAERRRSRERVDDRC